VSGVGSSLAGIWPTEVQSNGPRRRGIR
jgi:hypothetical protein